ncbi:hypothetical protein AMJ80_03080 [bacterium SM23_31]|nr:MAG: hypothetical protein AMJ80_03080 [bacterium SM23_31]
MFNYKHLIFLFIFLQLIPKIVSAQVIKSDDFGYPCTSTTKCIHACNGFKLQPIFSFASDEKIRLSINMVVAKRFYHRWGLGIVVPYVMSGESNNNYKGFHDLGFIFKRVLHVNESRGFIFTFGLFISPPTGDKSKGFTKDFTNLQPYFIFGKIFKYVKAETEFAINIPSDQNKGDLIYTWNTAFILNQQIKANIFMIEIAGSIFEDDIKDKSKIFIIPVLMKKIKFIPKSVIAMGIKYPIINLGNSNTSLICYYIREF